MDFRLSEEHEMFRDAFRTFLEREVEPLVEEYEEKEAFPRQVLRRMGEEGYLGMGYPEEVGGGGLDKYFDAIMSEELCRVCLGISASIFAHTSLGCYPLVVAGTPEQQEKWLKPALKGEIAAGFALTEPDAGSDAAAIRSTAVKDGNSWVLNGQKIYTTNGTIGDYMIFCAYTDKSQRGTGMALFILPNDNPGVTTTKLRKMGAHTSDTAEVFVEDARIPAENLIGKETGGFNIIKGNLASGRMLYGARSLGVARACYEESLRFAQERNAFGRPIGKFQLVSSKLAWMATNIEAMRALVYKTLWMSEEGMDVMRDASMVKLFCSETVQQIAWDAVQIHGGYGYMKEYKVERFFRDARLLTIPEGTSEVHQTIIAKAIGL